MEKTVKLFADMRGRDLGLVVKLDLDDEKRIRALFWCYGGGRRDYSCFGDVVTFDTTYRTNLYNLPFGLFVGVNRHFQTMIFGVVLMTEETTKMFEWASRSFVDTMGKAPLTILTGTPDNYSIWSLNFNYPMSFLAYQNNDGVLCRSVPGHAWSNFYCVSSNSASLV